MDKGWPKQVQIVEEKFTNTSTDTKECQTELKKILGYCIQSLENRSSSFFQSLYCQKVENVLVAEIRVSPMRMIGSIDPNLEPFYEFQLCDRGFGRIKQADSFVRASPGRMICFDSEKPFDLTTTGDEFRLLVVRIPKKELVGILGHYPTLSSCLVSESFGFGKIIAGFLPELVNHIQKIPSQNTIFLMRSITFLIKSALVDLQNMPPTSGKNAIFNRAKKIIDKNISEQSMNVNFIAKELGISAGYLSSVFRRNGLSIMSYVKQVRLLKGRQLLLEEPSKKIVEIADLCGFSSQSTFTHCFKEAFGMNPSLFRNRLGVTKK